VAKKIIVTNTKIKSVVFHNAYLLAVKLRFNAAQKIKIMRFRIWHYLMRLFHTDNGKLNKKL